MLDRWPPLGRRPSVPKRAPAAVELDKVPAYWPLRWGSSWAYGLDWMLGHLTPEERDELELVDVDAAGQTSIGVPGEQMPLAGLAPDAVPMLDPSLADGWHVPRGYAHAGDLLAILKRKEQRR